MAQTTARKIQAGDYFTDDTHHSFWADRIERCSNGLGVYVHVQGQGYPEFYTYDTPVDIKTVHAVPADKPFHAYYRVAKANGDTRKGYREFRTRAQLDRFIQTAPMSYAITSFN